MTTAVDFATGPELVYAVLGDARSLEYVVVGARKIRRFDPRWPALGTKIHHSVGVGPFTIRDTSEVLASDAPRLLVLAAHIRPIGSFRVEFALEATAGGCRLEVAEEPLTGPLALAALRPLVERLLDARNVELGRRLQRLVERRSRQAAMDFSATAGA